MPHPSDGFVVVVKMPRLTPDEVAAIARRFAVRLLAEAEREGMLSAVSCKEVPPRGGHRRRRDRGK